MYMEWECGGGGESRLVDHRFFLGSRLALSVWGDVGQMAVQLM